MLNKPVFRKKTILLLYSILLLAVVPLSLRSPGNTAGSTGYFISDPVDGNSLYLEKYDLTLSSVDRKGCTFFFLPAYAEITDLDQSLSAHKLLTADGSMLSDPYIGEVIDVFVDIGEDEPVPWQIAFLRSENLYSVFLDTGSMSLEDITKDDYLTMSVDIVSPDGITDTRNTSVAVKGHGNSTWNFGKNPYELKFPNEISLCGLPSSNKWILLANVFDGTKMANKLAFDLSDAIGMEYSIYSDWVDLYANGIYLGNYLLCKEPDIGKGKLDIGDLEPVNDPYWDPSHIFDTGKMKGFVYDDPPAQISGGYLFEKTRSDLYDEKKCGFMVNKDYFTIKSPNNASYQETDYIRSFTESVDESIRNPSDSLTGMIDAYSFTRRFLIEEIFFNADAMFSSYYFYKKPGLDTLYAGPAWDYDNSLGFGNDDFSLDPENSFLDNGTYFSNDVLDWDGLLYENEAYRDYMKIVFADNIPVFREFIDDQIYADFERIAASLQMDYILWGTEWCKYKVPFNNARFARFFLSKRLDHLCDVWNLDAGLFSDLSDGTTHTVTFRQSDGNITTITVRDGDLLSPDRSPYYDKEVYAGWCYEGTDTYFSFYLPIFEDISLELLPASEMP